MATQKRKDKEKVSAIVQARMDSSRLPGKVLMDIEGKPVLQHIIERLKKSKKIDEIILAIPDTKKNNILEKFAKKNKVKYYRGSEENVLERYYKAAVKFKSNAILRVTADSPLLDPHIVDLIIGKYFKSKKDFCCSSSKKPFPLGLGVEIFRFKALERSYKKAKSDFEKEHPDEYILGHSEIFSILEVENNVNFSFMRCTLDEIKDLEFIREIYKRIYLKKKIFYMQDIIKVLEKEPELIEINRSVK